MKKNICKFISLALALVLAAGMMPATASAADVPMVQSGVLGSGFAPGETMPDGTVVPFPDETEPSVEPSVEPSTAQGNYSSVKSGALGSGFAPGETLPDGTIAPFPDETEPSVEPSVEPETTVVTSYSDVAEDAWYHDAVTSISGLGIVLGVGENRFDPNGQLTWAQTIAFVVRTYQQQTGERVYGTADQTGAHWYDIYVDYAKNHGFISSVPANPNAYITRSDAAVLFDKALFDRTVVNELPTDYEYFFDVAKDDPAHDAIYSLASAGIVGGKDAQKFLARFCGDETLTRAEAATIVARMVNVVERATIDIWDLVVYGLDESHPYYDAIMACIRGELINTGNAYHEMPEGLYCPELFDFRTKTFYIAIDPDAVLTVGDMVTAAERIMLGYHPTYRYSGSVYEFDDGVWDYTVTYPDGHTEEMKARPQEAETWDILLQLINNAARFSQPIDSQIGLPKQLNNGQVTVALEYMAKTLGVTKEDIAEGYTVRPHGYSEYDSFNKDQQALDYALEGKINTYFEHGSRHSGHVVTEGKAKLGEFCHLLYDLKWTTFRTMPGGKVDGEGNYYEFSESSGMFGDGYYKVILDSNGNPAPQVWDWLVEGPTWKRWDTFRTNSIYSHISFFGELSTDFSHLPG